MRVLLISDTEAKGGAAIAASRMACALAGQGHEIGMVVNDPQDGPPVGPWRRFVVGGGEAIPWDRVPDALLEAEAVDGLKRVLDDFSPDAVSVHNIHGGAKVGWSVDMVRVCADRVPTVWTLHDTWSFTGRCAYLNGCPFFPDRCGRDCPSSGEYPFLNPDRVPGEFARKRDVLTRAGRLAAAAPSGWMADLAGRSAWAGREIRRIPNCLDAEVFFPGDQAEARRALGLDVEGRVVLLCAADCSDPRKGVGLAVEALGRMDRPPTLLVMGRPTDFSGAEDMRVIRLDFVADDADKRQAYSAADIMVHPALQDNLPNTVLESLACGTPVAGFDIGGMSDLVLDGQTGRLADTVSPQGLVSAVEDCLARSAVLGAAGRTHVLERYAEAETAACWTALIESMKE